METIPHRGSPSRFGGGERGDGGSGQNGADEAGDAASALGRVAEEDVCRMREIRPAGSMRGEEETGCG